MDEINRDYASYNDMTVIYRKIINSNIENNLVYSEKCWAITVITCVTSFPIMAMLTNLHSTLFAAEPKRYMIHDIMLPYTDPEQRFESPIFEIMFAYMLYACALYIINFIGYDGFFGLCINHACLKMEIYCRSFEEALRENNERCMHLKIVKIIVEQNKLKRLVSFRAPYLLRKKGTLVRSLCCPSVCLSVSQEPLSQDSYFDTINGN